MQMLATLGSLGDNPINQQFLSRGNTFAHKISLNAQNVAELRTGIVIVVVVVSTHWAGQSVKLVVGLSPRKRIGCRRERIWSRDNIVSRTTHSELAHEPFQVEHQVAITIVSSAVGSSLILCTRWLAGWTKTGPMSELESWPRN